MKRIQHRIALAAVAAITCLCLAGCGGGGSETQAIEEQCKTDVNEAVMREYVVTPLESIQSASGDKREGIEYDSITQSEDGSYAVKGTLVAMGYGGDDYLFEFEGTYQLKDGEASKVSLEISEPEPFHW